MQRHVIRQQVIEVTTDDEAGAYQLQTELNRIYGARVVPLIERACDQLGDPNVLLRIDSLVLDVGAIPREGLESALVERIAALLPDALARAARQSPVEAQPPAELLVYFAYTGVLPWWVSDPPANLIPQTVTRLLKSGNDDLRAALRAIADSDDALMRLVRHLDDQLLSAVCAALLPHGDFVRWIAAFRPPVRHHFWANAIRVLLTENPAKTWFEAALSQTAHDARVSLDELIPPDTEQRETVQPEPSRVDSPIDYTQIENILRAAWEKSNRQPDVLLSLLPTEYRAYIARLIASITTNSDAPTLTDSWFESLLRAIRAQIAADSERDSQASATRPDTAAPSSLSTPSRAASSPRSAPRADRPIDLRFSDGDSVYVENAGLVILWHFLVPFFTNVDLVADRQFKDAAAQQRAVGLLHVLATGQPDFPEYLLPLNKVLCGLRVDAPFDFGDPLTEAENEACDVLLQAVIERAPVLRDMSVNGLRGTFLLRRGTLRGEEGGWLLRVERQTYDLVLDQFPWSWKWLRLPWMDAPMRVEW